MDVLPSSVALDASTVRRGGATVVCALAKRERRGLIGLCTVVRDSGGAAPGVMYVVLSSCMPERIGSFRVQQQFPMLRLSVNLTMTCYPDMAVFFAGTPT